MEILANGDRWVEISNIKLEEDDMLTNILDIYRDIEQTNLPISKVSKNDDVMVKSNGDNASNSTEHVVISIVDMVVGSKTVIHIVKDLESPYSAFPYSNNSKGKRDGNLHELHLKRCKTSDLEDQ